MRDKSRTSSSVPLSGSKRWFCRPPQDNEAAARTSTAALSSRTGADWLAGPVPGSWARIEGRTPKREETEATFACDRRGHHEIAFSR